MNAPLDIAALEQQRRNAKLKSIITSNENITKAFEDLSAPNKLPERIFIQSFLPFFCGETKLEQQPDVLVLWYGIAGSPSSEVEIIDNKGDTLFRVPALIDTSIINPIRSDKNNISFADIINATAHYDTTTPILGERLLLQNLSVKEKEIQSKSSQFTENEKRWYDIFVRYEKVKQSPITTEQQIKDSGALTDDDLVY